MSFKTGFRVTLLFIVLGVFLFALFPVDRKKAVSSLLGKAQRHIQEKNLKKLMPLFSIYYKDDAGGTYASLGEGFEYAFKEYNDIRITWTVRDISFGRDTCTASIALRVRGRWMGVERDLVGTVREGKPLDVYCGREFLRWKILGARWPGGPPATPGYY
jgi:hypothetical protein